MIAPGTLMRILAALLASALVGGCTAAPTTHVDACPVPAGALCSRELPLGGAWALPYFSNYPLSGATSVRSAVVMVHGILRNADAYFQATMEAAHAAGQAQQTIVVAPRFFAHADHPTAGQPYWASKGWKEGDNAEAPAGLSSFSVLDRILATLADRTRFPNLTSITVAGHSAGAQLVQRYAAVGHPPQAPGLAVSYVVANPSSYLYFGPERPEPVRTGCAADDYEYGMQHPNPYIGSRPAAALFAQYAGQRVTYLQGGADVATGGKESHYLDTSCAAEAQGKNRFERSAHYVDYVLAHFPGAPHTRIVVPGVGHDNVRMFDSPQGLAALFPLTAPTP